MTSPKVSITFECDSYEATLLTALYEVLTIPANMPLDKSVALMSSFSLDAIASIADELSVVVGEVKVHLDPMTTSAPFHALVDVAKELSCWTREKQT